MLYIEPEINDIANQREIYSAVQAALLHLPRFPDLTLQAVVVISDTCMTSITHLRHPEDDNSQRDLSHPGAHVIGGVTRHEALARMKS